MRRPARANGSLELRCTVSPVYLCVRNRFKATWTRSSVIPSIGLHRISSAGGGEGNSLA